MQFIYYLQEEESTGLPLSRNEAKFKCRFESMCPWHAKLNVSHANQPLSVCLQGSLPGTRLSAVVKSDGGSLPDRRILGFTQLGWSRQNQAQNSFVRFRRSTGSSFARRLCLQCLVCPIMMECQRFSVDLLVYQFNGKISTRNVQ